MLLVNAPHESSLLAGVVSTHRWRFSSIHVPLVKILLKQYVNHCIRILFLSVQLSCQGINIETFCFTNRSPPRTQCLPPRFFDSLYIGPSWKWLLLNRAVYLHARSKWILRRSNRIFDDLVDDYTGARGRMRITGLWSFRSQRDSIVRVLSRNIITPCRFATLLLTISNSVNTVLTGIGVIFFESRHRARETHAWSGSVAFVSSRYVRN